jgi:hypothetical protein
MLLLEVLADLIFVISVPPLYPLSWVAHSDEIPCDVCKVQVEPISPEALLLKANALPEKVTRAHESEYSPLLLLQVFIIIPERLLTPHYLRVDSPSYAARIHEM